MRRRRDITLQCALAAALLIFGGSVTGCSKEEAQTPAAPAAGAVGGTGVSTPPPANYSTSGKRMQPPPPGMPVVPAPPR